MVKNGKKQSETKREEEHAKGKEADGKGRGDH